MRFGRPGREQLGYVVVAEHGDRGLCKQASTSAIHGSGANNDRRR
jgi:hypothetical protein